MADTTTTTTVYQAIEADRFTGRAAMSTSIDPKTPDNVITILNTMLPTFNKNVEEMEKLRRYYGGAQDILWREKDIRPKINNKTVVNYALMITDFWKGHTVGEGVPYVQRSAKSEADAKAIADNIATLNDYMHVQCKRAMDIDLMEDVLITGQGYRIILANASMDKVSAEEDQVPFRMGRLEPQETFIVYSTDFTKAPVMAVVRKELSVITEGSAQVDSIVAAASKANTDYHYGVYTKDKYYLFITNTNNYINPNTKPDETKPNGLGVIPIVEYYLNKSRLGIFEPILTLQDAANEGISDRHNALEQFVQAYWKFAGCRIDMDNYEAFLKKGAIMVPPNAAGETSRIDIDLVTKELNQAQTQILTDYEDAKIYEITATPQNKASAGGNTGTALEISQGWIKTDTASDTVEGQFQRAETEMLKVLLRIPAVRKSLKGLKVANVDIHFSRNKTSNLLVKTQALINQLTAGVHPEKAFKVIGLYKDSADVYEASRPFLKKWDFVAAPIKIEETDEI